MTTESGAPSYELRQLQADEIPTVHQMLARAFLRDPMPEELALDVPLVEPERAVGVFDGTLVGSAVAFSRRLTVPGGPAPVGAVSWVAVAATHRRRGVLTAMMRHQLAALHEQGVAVAVLWASEAAIYGRFGYGVAARHARLRADTREARIRRDVERGDGRLVPSGVDDGRTVVAEVYEAARLDRVGFLDRPGGWWDHRLADLEVWRHGLSALRCVHHERRDGTADGYALYASKADWSETGPAGEIQVRELVALTPEAYAALWGFLLETDLVRSVTYGMTTADEPLVHLVDNPRGLEQRLSDALWVRLVDVPRALAARRYNAPVDVVLDVSDPTCPWNAGRLRLVGGPAGAACEPTARPADLAVSSRTLGAAYLGGVTLSELGRAGLVDERRAGALRVAATAFAEPLQPCCPEVF